MNSSPMVRGVGEGEDEEEEGEGEGGGEGMVGMRGADGGGEGFDRRTRGCFRLFWRGATASVLPRSS